MEIWVNRDKCLSCFSCKISCAVAHSGSGSLLKALEEEPAPEPRVFSVSDEKGKFVFMCRHCENALCVESCMSAAVTRDPVTGTVKIDQERCVGCWMCIMVCPFGVIGRDKNHTFSIKCDFCPDRESPACVDSCPTGALVLCDGEDYTGLVRRDYAAAFMRKEGGASS